MLIFSTATVFCDEEPAVREALKLEADALTTELRADNISTDVIARQRQLAEKIQQLLTRASESSSNEPSETPLPPTLPTPPTTQQSSGLGNAGDTQGNMERPELREVERQTVTRPLADSVWGHLPEHERDELYRSFTEQFLPKYDRELRAYFRALAAEPVLAPPASKNVMNE
ncbi:MAG: hypothetical protein KDA88_24375 [Planctomycetaceae bacterium]|nr:hypothetical protein [Planctomycetaceae bacterium]